MSVLKLVEYPNDILETKCKQVTSFDSDLIKLLDSMHEIMIEADGVGLAAPQVGIDKQIAIVEIDDEHGRIDLVNPVILEMKGEQIGPEGCLSFPGLFGEVKRADYVKIKAQDHRGQTFILEAEGFLSRAIQHEIDHLNGVLFTSKVIRYYDEGELEG